MPLPAPREPSATSDPRDANDTPLHVGDVVTAYGPDRLLITGFTYEAPGGVAHVRCTDPRYTTLGVVRAALLIRVPHRPAAYTLRVDVVPGVEVRVSPLDWRGRLLREHGEVRMCFAQGCRHDDSVGYAHPDAAGYLGWYAEVWIDGIPVHGATSDGRTGEVSAAVRALGPLVALEARAESAQEATRRRALRVLLGGREVMDAAVVLSNLAGRSAHPPEPGAWQWHTAADRWERFPGADGYGGAA